MQDGQRLNVSPASSPDLDWSQVNETVRMLNLAVAQISMAMHEGDDSVESLTTSFLGMVQSVDSISQATTSASPETDFEPVREDILNRCTSVQGKIQQSIVAFQFYDRLSQRLDHVRQALGALSDLVSDKSRLFNPTEWSALQSGIRSRYTMQEEQDMFEALLKGASIDEALEQVRGRLEKGDIDDIELF